MRFCLNKIHLIKLIQSFSISTMKTFKRILTILVIVLCCADSARILGFYPMPSISHQIVFRPLMLELAKRHEVVVITPNPMFSKDEAPENYTEIDIHDVSYSTWKKFVELSKGTKDDLVTQIKVGYDVVREIVNKQFQVKKIQDIVKGYGKFDLLMLEACVRGILALSHVYKVPVIQVSSFGAMLGNYQSVGVPMHPLLYPFPLNQRIYNLTMWEKINELYNFHVLHKYYYETDVDEHEVMKRHFGKDVPTVMELRENIDMMFINMNPIWEGSRPVPPNVIHMGGLPDKPENKLPTDLQKYLDSSKDGVIYLSFGTNVKSAMLSQKKIQAIVKVLSKLPYDVIFKWDLDELPGKSDNIKIAKWLSQWDLLRHPSIKLFITQGGLQSTDEAIKAGVPLIGIPMLADQWYNVEKYVYHKIGIGVDFSSLTEESFSKAVHTILEDDSYRQNIINLRNLMQDQPMKPLERAVWWTEHVLRHGGAKHLRSPAANITWTQYLELDLIALVTSSLLFATLIVIGIVYNVYLKMNN